eukprot:GILJ01002872.1.p1 GENE.GILJ01002872.1~~GILJ01002872.1.p1  ORF type:complete len:191 (-),score=33.90 GILJ01002872.1:180-707(-)
MEREEEEAKTEETQAAPAADGVPVQVVYCEVCSLPTEYCEYGPTPQACLAKAVGGVDIDAPPQEEVKILPGGKKKVVIKETPKVIIKKTQRNKRKFVTSIIGLESFNIKLQDAAKAFGKKFACGSSVVRGQAGVPDEIDVQGDVEYDIVDFITEKWPQIEEDMIEFVEDKKKSAQ